MSNTSKGIQEPVLECLCFKKVAQIHEITVSFGVQTIIFVLKNQSSTHLVKKIFS
jgi:hypothetical protein